MGNANDCGQRRRSYSLFISGASNDLSTNDIVYTEDQQRDMLFMEDGRAEILLKQGGEASSKWAAEFNRTLRMNSVRRRRRHDGTVHGSFTFRTDSGSSAQLPATRTLCCIIDGLRQSLARLLGKWHVWDDPSSQPTAVHKIVSSFYHKANFREFTKPHSKASKHNH